MTGLPIAQPQSDSVNTRAIPAAQRDSWARMLARLVPEATCLTCGGPAPRDGRHLCPACRAKAEEGQ